MRRRLSCWKTWRHGHGSRPRSLAVPRPAGEQAPDIASTATPQGSQAAGSTAAPSDTKSDKQPVLRIVPKGLRSFDEHDADFFLELLPGPRDRDGLPESIRFWKMRIEETDPDKTFRVGLIYGPSGCGKSSLVKAGLLPRLAAHVVPVYVEATAEDTELRLLKGLRRRFATIPAESGAARRAGRDSRRTWVPENTQGPAGAGPVRAMAARPPWRTGHAAGAGPAAL